MVKSLSRNLRTGSWAAAGVLPALLGACASTPPTENLTPAQWRADLQVLARELPARHLNAFHVVSRATFEAAIADLELRVATLDGDHIVVGMERIVRMIGDGHTGVTGFDHADVLPIRLRRFGAEWRVVQTRADGQAARGARVVAIGGVPIAEAHRRMLEVTPADESAELRDELADQRLTKGIFLHGMDLARDAQHARFDLLDDQGHPFSLDLTPGPTSAVGPDSWQDVSAQIPLRQQHPDDPLWCQPLQDERVLYCDFRSYRDLRAPAAALRHRLQVAPPDKLIVDLRQNGGGDYFVGLHQLVNPIAASAVNQRGHLFVLIGNLTFSAAMSNAAHFRQRTAAILVGEPIGERPNSYQENRQLSLPNSHIVISYSTRFYQFAPGSAENRIRPDIEVKTTWEEVKAGLDPVLQRALD
ncbi:MAG: hypothetical protein JOZ03_13575 [Gammaproteobacteria bacterium]|nr:hypothetical protein [Gammaproteobacteria bacterium]